MEYISLSVQGIPPVKSGLRRGKRRGMDCLLSRIPL